MRRRNSPVCGNDRIYLCTFRCLPVKGRNRGTKCGLGRNRTSRTRSASDGTPKRYPKLTTETSIGRLSGFLNLAVTKLRNSRSEERRVGKECRSRRWPQREK